MTFTANQRLTIVLHIIATVALAFVLGYSTGHDDAPNYDAALFECEKVDISGMGDDMLGLLGGIGYKGDYRDDSDNLMYSPACDIPTAPWLLTQPE